MAVALAQQAPWNLLHDPVALMSLHDRVTARRVLQVRHVHRVKGRHVDRVGGHRVLQPFAPLLGRRRARRQKGRRQCLAEQGRQIGRNVLLHVLPIAAKLLQVAVDQAGHANRPVLFLIGILICLSNRLEPLLLLQICSGRSLERRRLLGRPRPRPADFQRALIGVRQKRGQLRQGRRQDGVGNRQGCGHRIFLLH